jgi:hypothetical protein
MKHIAFGPNTYISDRILSIISSIYRPAGDYAIHGINDTTIPSLMTIKATIKEDAHHVHYIPMLQGNTLPALMEAPPSSFDYHAIYLDYTLYDFMLYKAIEVMPKDIISIQNINSFLLNNEQSTKQWKGVYDMMTKAGEYDLSFAKKLNIVKCMENPAEYLSTFLDIPLLSVSYAVNENCADTNPAYANTFGIPEPYFKPLSNILLSEQTIEYILKL